MAAKQGKGPLVGAIDEGTSSARFTVYDAQGKAVASQQKEIAILTPQEGWAEQDPMLILRVVKELMALVMKECESLGYVASDLKAIGVTNQRETTVVWDRATGRPLHNAILWLDSRTSDTVDSLISRTETKDKGALQRLCGLPISTYFSAVKLRWLLDNVEAVREETASGRCLFGTIDSWLIYHLTGGANGGIHVTDCTNASRTMLMNINTLEWDPQLCKFFGVAETMLPRICSSSEIFGYVKEGPAKGVPISGCLGDQQSALVGQMCLNMGDAKNTYGTGCFLLYNTGTRPVHSQHGLLTTVAYKFGPGSPTYYALEGSIAIAGAAVQWLRDSLQIIKTSSEVEELAKQVDTCHGVYFVPAFSGLLAPYWRHDARGVICGLSQYSNKAHIARATLEAVCFQTREVLEAMNKDCRIPLSTLKVDGGMTRNNLLLQLQADLLGIVVERPQNIETTSFGAALAAGVATGVDVYSLRKLNELANPTLFKPTNTVDDRDERYSMWRKAVQHSFGWEKKSGAERSGSIAKPAQANRRLLPILLFGTAVACAAYFYSNQRRH